jgi:hypothetical protein
MKRHQSSPHRLFMTSVYPSTVAQLTVEHLKELGVERIGERDLRSRCKAMQKCNFFVQLS